MVFFFKLIIASALAVALGLWSALYAVDQGLGFEAVKRGNWVAWSRAGLPDADPYTRAAFARNGELPLVGGQSIAFSTTRDDNGMTLRRGCTYRLSGKAPPSQWWTLSVYDLDGKPLTDARSGRFGFSSSEIIYRPDGSFEVVLAPTPTPGNWIPVDGEGRLRLFLRFYDTPVALGTSFEGASMPRLIGDACP